eukprot:NODE_10652_length_481_cov_23.790960_g10629_i0.p1 GENE.NODE_10652_length_481_cov_23.790960_g10629_i0~~NODE_10652_length_481_cov_23.790960_g10629_i0.p1  ORF type:complete len:157 (-),score=33.73 NODE_10652_length_481_cov_23.790960_g10629_i0:10-435(-)
MGEAKVLDALEVFDKQEALILEMDSITEVNVPLWLCKECRTKSLRLEKHCRERNHTIKKVDGFKHFWKCTCGARTHTLHVKGKSVVAYVPTHQCDRCMDGKWTRASMYKGVVDAPRLKMEVRGGETGFSLRGDLTAMATDD